MTEEVKFILDSAKEEMLSAISHLESERVKVRAGRATPSIVENILVDYYKGKERKNYSFAVLSILSSTFNFKKNIIFNINYDIF